MKKTLIMLVAGGFLLACNSQNESANLPEAKSALDSHEAHHDQPLTLVLNNGEKWNVDISTLLNVAVIEDVVLDARESGPEGFAHTPARLEEGLSRMVSECEMKGADHDALHQWLEPLMVKAKELKVATSEDQVYAVLGEMEKHIDLFDRYFE